MMRLVPSVQLLVSLVCRATRWGHEMLGDSIARAYDVQLAKDHMQPALFPSLFHSRPYVHSDSISSIDALASEADNLLLPLALIHFNFSSRQQDPRRGACVRRRILAEAHVCDSQSREQQE